MKFLVATALVIALGSTSAFAQSTMMRSNEGVASFPKIILQVSPRIMASYMQTSGDKLQILQDDGRAAADQEVPPTDCPPAPTQDCLDSWKQTVDPFK